MALAICLCSLVPAYAQEDAPKESIDLEIIEKIKKEGLENSQVMDIALYLTDVSGPRLTNSPGFDRAADWVSSTLKEWGLKKINKEPWGEFGKGWENKKMYVAMTAPYYQPLIAFPRAWTPGTDGPVSGNLVMIDAKTDEDLAAYKGKLKGKIVLIKPTVEVTTSFEADASRYTEEELAKLAEPSSGGGGYASRYSAEQIAQWRAQRAMGEKISAFMAFEGASLVIKGVRGKEGTLFTGGGRGYKSNAQSELPTIEMQAEHALRLARLVEEGVEVGIEAEVRNEFYEEDLQGYNVLAEIPGKDGKLKKELVMLGAHLDSWHSATGATDNAAGSAVMMEAVRILKAVGVKPRRTIRIALWSGEEQGLYGSRGYVENHFGTFSSMELKPDHEKLSAYYNIDNGTGRIRGIYLQGNEAVRPIFDQWFQPLDDIVDNRTITIRNTGGTDHQSFDRVGLPGFQFIQDRISYNTRTHHTNMDTYERLQPEDLKQMAVIVATFVYNTAMRDEKLPREELPAKSESGR